MSEPTYTITVTGTQLGLLCEAAELLSRIHLGQLEHVEEKLYGLPIDESLELQRGLRALNPLITGLNNPNASRPLNECMRLRHDQAWGLYWGLRYPLYLERCTQLGKEAEGWSVMSHPPQPCGGQPVPTVTRAETDLDALEDMLSECGGYNLKLEAIESGWRVEYEHDRITYMGEAETPKEAMVIARIENILANIVYAGPFDLQFTPEQLNDIRRQCYLDELGREPEGEYSGHYLEAQP